MLISCHSTATLDDAEAAFLSGRVSIIETTPRPAVSPTLKIMATKKAVEEEISNRLGAIGVRVQLGSGLEL
jgi:hypothetical protein